jgi:hypothetical protein
MTHLSICLIERSMRFLMSAKNVDALDVYTLSMNARMLSSPYNHNARMPCEHAGGPEVNETMQSSVTARTLYD